MDGMTERVQALRAFLGPDATQQLLALYGDTEATKAAGMRTSYKASAATPATSPIDDALDALSAALDEVATDANEQQIADYLTACTAKLTQMPTAAPVKRSTKLSDSGPQSVPPKAAKEKSDPPYTSASPDQKRRTARTFMGWMGLDGPAKEDPAETQRKIYEDQDNFLGLGRLQKGPRKQ